MKNSMESYTNKINIVVIQNVGINDSHAIAVTLSNLVTYFEHSNELLLNIICGKSSKSEQKIAFSRNTKIIELNTGLYSLIGNVKFILYAYKELKKHHKCTI